jgi:hypothetical protein
MTGMARRTAGERDLKAMLAPYLPRTWPVSARVGNVKNNDPSLIESAAAALPCRAFAGQGIKNGTIGGRYCWLNWTIPFPSG